MNNRTGPRNVPFDVARELFDRPSAGLTAKESKQIQDYVFHWIIQKSIVYDLPIQSGAWMVKEDVSITFSSSDSGEI